MNKILVALCLFLCFNAHANKFVSVFTDPANDVSWSKALPSRYSNGCVNQNGYFYIYLCRQNENFVNGFSTPVLVNGYYEVDLLRSDADRACYAIGASLPTKRDYQSLVRQFDHDDRGRLTSAGVAAMQDVFSDVDSKWWWTKTNGYTAIYKDFDRAYGFYVSEDGPEAGMASFKTFRRDELGAVRCVKRKNEQ